MISALNGGNTAQPEIGHPDLDWTGVGWDGTLPDPATPASFRHTVVGARFVAGLGLNPVITAAAVHRQWFATQVAERRTVPGASDAFVAAVQAALKEARHVSQ